MVCAMDGCSQEAQYDVLCDIHYKHQVWQDNSNSVDPGIIKFAFDLFPHRFDPQYGTAQLHRDLCYDILRAHAYGDDKMDRMHVVAAPREHSKSGYISFVVPLYMTLFRYKKFIVLISESATKTIQFIRSIKKALSLPIVKYYFGDVTARDVEEGGKWTETHIVTKTGIHIMALGMGKSARGLNEDARPDLIIADDVESENNTKTEDSRNNNWDWWKAQVVPAADMIDGQCIYIGTMVHYDCTLARLFDYQSAWVQGEGGYHKRFYQVWTDDTHTETIWPEKFPVDRVHKIERDYRADPQKGVDQFYREYLNIAVAPESRRFTDGVIQEEKFTYQYVNNVSYLHFPDRKGDKKYESVHISLGIDPASSKRRTAANSGFIVLATDSYGNQYVLEAYRRKVHLSRGPDDKEDGLMEITERFFRTYHPSDIAMEVTGVGRPIMQALRIRIREICDSDRALKIPRLTEIEALPTISKEENIINTLEMPFKSMRIFMLPTHAELMSELSQFPKGRYMDLLDAMCDAIKVSHVLPRIIHTQADVLGIRFDPKEHEYRPSGRKYDWQTAV